MLHIVNHHTAYSYSKLTCRHQSLALILTKVNEKRNTPLGFKPRQESKARQTPQTNAENKFFKTKELLCWRSDLAFFNLRWYFLNTFKALHLCWSAVRNNKRIAFVALNDDLQSQASLEDIHKLFKSKALLRDVLPAIKSNISYLELKASPARRSSSNGHAAKIATTEPFEGALTIPNASEKSRLHRSKAFRQGEDPLLFGGLSRFLRNCGVKPIKTKPPFKNKADLKDLPRNDLKSKPAVDQLHRLQAKLNLGAGRQSTLLYDLAGTGFFSNPEKSLKLAFGSQNLSLPKKSLPGYENSLLFKPLPGLKQYNLNLSLITMSPRISFLPGELKTDGRRRLLESLAPLQKSLSKSTVKKPNARSQKANLSLCFGSLKKLKPAYEARVQDLSVKSALSNGSGVSKMQGLKAFLLPQLNLRHTTQKPASRRAYAGKRSALGHSMVQAKRYLNLKPWWQKQNLYGSALGRNQAKDYQKFAANPNLKQADVIIFTNPDKTPALAAQAKRLRIPTVGLVSGLKSKHVSGHQKHLNQNNSVDFPILGNPDNHFFVFMMVRMFLNLTAKAYGKKFTSFTSASHMGAKAQETPKPVIPGRRFALQSPRTDGTRRSTGKNKLKSSANPPSKPRQNQKNRLKRLDMLTRHNVTA